MFDGFNVPLRSAISIRLGNLSKEYANIYFTGTLSIDSRGEGVHAKQNLGGIKTYRTITMTGKGKSVLVP